ncbi:hypothetical protein GCM10010412_041460 [Nonomuraea recticatena]|uniref:Transmembrane protein n=1 Tax=Nonomuraea recticatena TaxID=46178 RepID=A0ABP6ECS7_9ACTN
MSEYLRALGFGFGVMFMVFLLFGVPAFLFPPLFHIWSRWDTYWKRKGNGAMDKRLPKYD